MASCLPNFSDYKTCQPTKSCYLDGRYFNKVFANYPGLVHKPLVIKFVPGDIKVEVPEIKKDCNCNSILRVVVEVCVEKKICPPLSPRPVCPTSCPSSPRKVVQQSCQQPSCHIAKKQQLDCQLRHDMTAVIDHRVKMIYLFDPFTNEYAHYIAKIIQECLGYHVFKVHETAPVVKNSNCDMSGFCSAYAIKFGMDYINKQPCDFSNVKSFAARIEKEYPHLPGSVDRTFGFWDNPEIRNTILGGLGGAAVGTIAGGGLGGGTLVGGLLGGGAGYALTRGGIF